MPPQSSLPEWLAGALAALQAGDIDQWMAVYAEDAVHEFPFASEGGPRRLEGQGTIRAFIEPLLAGMRFGEFSDIRVHDAGGELIVEATGHHLSASDGAHLTIGYVWFITRLDGKVVHIRDYMKLL